MRAFHIPAIFGVVLCALLTPCTGETLNLKAISDQKLPEPISAKQQLAISSSSFEIFCDFRCPYCAKFFTMLFAGAKYEGKKLIYVFKHFPFHSRSGLLAKFYESIILHYPAEKDSVIDSLYKFRDQDNTEQLMSGLVAVYGFNSSLISRDISARDTELKIEESKQSAVSRSIEHTPAVFYMGQEVTLDEPEELARFVLERSPLSNSESQTQPETGCLACNNTEGLK